MRNSLHVQLDRLASDRWARRGVRLLLRASGLAISLVCVAVGVQLLLGISLRWSFVSAAALICIAGGAVLVLRPRMSASEVARRLDRRFQLRNQLATALEVGPQADGVGRYLQEQSKQTLAQLRRQLVGRQGFPWSELVLVLALTLLLGGLLVLSGIGPAELTPGVDPLPPLAQPENPNEQFPAEPFQPPPGSQPGPGQTSLPGPGDAAAVAALADALRDQSVTRPAAEALDQGNVSEAAQSLRELADQAGQLSPRARAELSESLDDAANQIEPSNPDLAEQLRESAQDLRGAGSQPAEALENLAEALEQLGAGQQPGQGQGEGEGQGEGQGSDGAGQGSLPGEQREGSNERLGVDGVPLELESDGAGDTPTGGEPQGTPSGGNGSGGGGFSRGNPSGERVEIGDDPLRIPADLRDVVQDYFSP